MWKKTAKGTIEMVQGLPCNIPAKPSDSLIMNFDLPKKDQYWRRTPKPDNFHERLLEEKAERLLQKQQVEEGVLKNVTHVDPVLNAFRRQEWLRRWFGFWFFNNGRPTYITGKMYYYLNYCYVMNPTDPDGMPNYYDAMRKRFYFRSYCETDPLCIGYIFIGGRGYGKTSEELACMMESLTRPPFNRHGSIQTLSDLHVKTKVFQEKLRPMWDNMIDFFRPEYDHGTKPQEKLSFYQDAIKGKAAKAVVKGKHYELATSLSIANSQVETLDSSNRKEILNSEVGKTDPATADIEARAQTNARCVVRNGIKIGMLRLESTVEEMDKGGALTESIWNKSNQLERNELGQTLSKMYRYFQPQDEVENNFVDKYGHVDREKARAYILADRESVKHDRKEYVSRMRKSPLSIQEAFIKDATKCLFNVQVLNDVRNKLARLRSKPYVVGNFVWVNEQFGEVEFVEDVVNGRFKVALLLNDEGEFCSYNVKSKKLKNAVGRIQTVKKGKEVTEYYPLNGDKFRMGCDPIKYKKSFDPRVSKFAAHGFHMYDPQLDQAKDHNDWVSYNYFFQYRNRPDDPEDAFWDMVKVMFYYGMPCFPETNVTDFTLFLVSNGLEKFILNINDIPDHILESKKQVDHGAASTDEVIEKYVALLITFINRHGMRFKFEETVEDWYEFDSKKTNQFDCAVSSGFTQLAIQCTLPDFAELRVDEISDWFDSYDNEGMRSHPILPDEYDDRESWEDVLS